MRNRFVLCIVAVLLLGGSLFAQTPDDWLALIEEQLAGLSVDVRRLYEDQADSFFDDFVNLVEGETTETADEVTAEIQARGRLLYTQLGGIEVPGGVIDLTPGAAVYKYEPEGVWSSGPHRLELQTVAIVNQWIRASLRSSQILWKVIKPGIYVTDSMLMNIHSNGGVVVTLTNLGPLEYTDPITGAVHEIETAYAMTDFFNTLPNEVYRGPDLPAGTVALIDWVNDTGTEPPVGSATLGPHTLVKLWNRIFVDSNDPPGRYETPNGPSAVITLSALP
jgi:hypothetical protein